ncbi:MAG: bifunctional 4-hydroxy-2-oxoglutarate aldolase/2-dehydro-3-deoxy-phosphogluconate aldolase [Marmoricola sp.]
MSDLEELLGRHRFLPVLTVGGASDGRRLGEALLAGGLPLAEVTLRAEGAWEALEAMLALDGIVAGVGTVTTADQVDRAAAAGARFVVSPGYDDAVVDRCRERAVPAVPGTATPTEIMRALAAGLTTVKLFPAGLVGGPAAVEAYAAPFPGLRFVPTGGVTLDTAADYFAHHAVLAVGGSWIAPRDAVAAGRWDEIEERARATVARLSHRSEVSP